MKLYKILTTAESSGDMVEISDKKNRIAGYFIWNTNDGKFLRFTTVEGKAQEFLSKSQIIKADYIPSNISVPLFSEKARSVFEAELPDEMEFHKININTAEDVTVFYICKCKVYCKLVNKNSSSYRDLQDGSLILSDPVFMSRIAGDFHIARDIDNPQILVVSDLFVDLCQKRNLRIDFSNTVQV